MAERLNRLQLACAYGGVCAVVLTGLYPPWVQTFYRARMKRPAGYSLLFTPPQVSGGGVEIDWSRLLLQWILIAVVFGAVVWVLGRKKSDAA
jgi:hypothetical protein